MRARVGVPVQDFLFYATVGTASGDVTAKTTNPAGVNYSDTQRREGWVVGLGTEMAFTNNLSGRIEWLQTDLGSDRYTVDTGSSVDVDTVIHTWRVGVNWRF